MDISCEKYGFKSTLKPINIAIVKTDENGAVCDFTYISNHLDLYDEQTMIDGIEILQKANVGGTRNSLC